MTTGAYRAATIGITPLGRRIIAPTELGDDVGGKREAILQPKIMRQFYEKYNGSRFPPDDIAGNVLVSMGLPKDRITKAVKLLRDNAEQVGILKIAPNGTYIDLQKVAVPISADSDDSDLRAAQSSQQQASRTTAVESSNQTNVAGIVAQVDPQLYVNLEIHIDANMTEEKIESIFKNMRKYIMGKE